MTCQTWIELPNHCKYFSNSGQETSITISGRREHVSPAVVMTPDTGSRAKCGRSKQLGRLHNHIQKYENARVLQRCLGSPECG